MNKQIKIVVYLIVTLFFSCNNGVVQNFKTISDLRSKFDIHSVELSQDMDGKNLNFLLRDLDFYEFDENELKAKAIEINEYLINKYSEIKNAEKIRYDFTSPADVGHVVFNKEGKILEFLFSKKEGKTYEIDLTFD